MIRYFYNLIYRKDIEYGETFDLGVFSTKSKVKSKMNQALKCSGFNNVKCFEIIKFGVKVSQNVEKSGLKLYFVDHEYSVVESNEIFDIIKHIGVFSSKNEAE